MKLIPPPPQKKKKKKENFFLCTTRIRKLTILTTILQEGEQRPSMLLPIPSSAGIEGEDTIVFLL